MRIAVLAYFVACFATAAYRFSRNYGTRIPVLKQVQSEGLTPGKSIVVIANPGYLRESALLTLYSPKSGTSQALAILQIIKCVQAEDIHAVPFPMGSVGDLGHYFDGGKTTLYAVPIVNVADFDLIGMKLAELQRLALAAEKGATSAQSLETGTAVGSA